MSSGNIDLDFLGFIKTLTTKYDKNLRDFELKKIEMEDLKLKLEEEKKKHAAKLAEIKGSFERRKEEFIKEAQEKELLTENGEWTDDNDDEYDELEELEYGMENEDMDGTESSWDGDDCGGEEYYYHYEHGGASCQRPQLMERQSVPIPRDRLQLEVREHSRRSLTSITPTVSSGRAIESASGGRDSGYVLRNPPLDQRSNRSQLTPLQPLMSDSSETDNPQSFSRESLQDIKQEPVDHGYDRYEFPSEPNHYDLGFIKQEPSSRNSAQGGIKEKYENQDGFTRLAAGQVKMSIHHPSEMVLNGNFGMDYPTAMDVAFHQHPTSTCFTSYHKLLMVLENATKFSCYDPLPGQHLVIVMNNISKSERVSFYEALKRYLEKFGKHVLYFTFSSEMDSQVSLWYQRVREILKMMPNLKMIQLKVPLPPYWDKNWCKVELRDLQDICECVYPFPVFKQLVTVDFDNVPYPFLEAALKQNEGTIEKLQVTRTSAMGNWNEFGCLFLERLTDLSMTCYGMEEMCQLQFVNWPIKNLTVRLDFEMKLARDFDEVYKILNHFAETLVSLKITWFQRPLRTGKLSLPHLQKLEIYFVENSSLDFLQNLEALEQLKVHIKQQRKDTCGEMIRFYTDTKLMKESNIWLFVPTLKQFIITTYFEGTSKTYIHDNPNLGCSGETWKKK